MSGSNVCSIAVFTSLLTVAPLNFVYQEVWTSSSRGTARFYAFCSLLHLTQSCTVFNNTFHEKSAWFACISAWMLSARGSAYLLVYKIKWCYSVIGGFACWVQKSFHGLHRRGIMHLVESVHLFVLLCVLKEGPSSVQRNCLCVRRFIQIMVCLSTATSKILWRARFTLS